MLQITLYFILGIYLFINILLVIDELISNSNRPQPYRYTGLSKTVVIIAIALFGSLMLIYDKLDHYYLIKKSNKK